MSSPLSTSDKWKAVGAAVILLALVTVIVCAIRATSIPPATPAPGIVVDEPDCDLEDIVNRERDCGFRPRRSTLTKTPATPQKPATKPTRKTS